MRYAFLKALVVTALHSLVFEQSCGPLSTTLRHFSASHAHACKTCIAWSPQALGTRLRLAHFSPVAEALRDSRWLNGDLENQALGPNVAMNPCSTSLKARGCAFHRLPKVPFSLRHHRF